MGGGGSMAHMVSSLKSNNKLLHKRSRSFYNSNTQKYKANYKLGLKQFPKMSEQETLVFRKKLKRERKINDIKQMLLLGFIIVFVTIGVTYGINRIL